MLFNDSIEILDKGGLGCFLCRHDYGESSGLRARLLLARTKSEQVVLGKSTNSKQKRIVVIRGLASNSRGVPIRVCSLY